MFLRRKKEEKRMYTEAEVDEILDRAADALSDLSVPRLVDYAESSVFNGRDTWHGWREYLLTGNIENEYAKRAIEQYGEGRESIDKEACGSVEDTGRVIHTEKRNEKLKREKFKLYFGLFLNNLLDLAAMFYVSRDNGLTENEQWLIIGIFGVHWVIVMIIFTIQMMFLKYEE